MKIPSWEKQSEKVLFHSKIRKEKEYREISTIKGKDYEMALMVKLKPEETRVWEYYVDYWIVNPTTDEILPCNILYK